MIETYKNFNKPEPTYLTSDEYGPEAAICNALAFAGHTMPLGLFKDSCDSFGDFMKTNEAIETFYKNHAPVLYGDYRAKMPGYFKPSEIISVLVFGANQWLGQDVLKFEKMEVTAILDEVRKGSPVVVVAANEKEHKLVPIMGVSEKLDANGDVVDRVLEIPLDCQEVLSKGFDNAKPFGSNEKWVITIAPAEPVI